MSRRSALNHWLFNRAAMRPIGRWIFAARRHRQARRQSTATLFYRHLEQLRAFETAPLADLVSGTTLRILVVGCSIGCEAYTIAAYFQRMFTLLDVHIDAVDIDEAAIATAKAAVYGAQHGTTAARSPLERELHTLLFENDRDGWQIAGALRGRVNFRVGDILSNAFDRQHNYDCVFAQNLMIHMPRADVERALAGLTAALRPGGALFVAGMDLEDKPELIASQPLVAVDWNLAAIHNSDAVRRAAWPWQYWGLEPINRRAKSFTHRYATIFLKRCGA